MNLPPRYINWRMWEGKKVPCRPDGTSKDFDPHDPVNHLDRATAASSPHPVGFVICAEDGLFFLDMDKCLVNGAWTTEANAIFQSFGGAWGEVSQSGTGLHIIGRCDPSQLQDRRNKWDGWLECYTDKRFVAFGPHGWQPIGGTATDRDWTQQLLALVPQRALLGELPAGRDPAYTGPEDDEELLRKMLASGGGSANAFGGGVTVRNLWEADVTTLAMKYPPASDGGGVFDHSSADAALVSHLAFWTGKDMPRMDRLFRRSALMRDKWDKMHGKSTYGQMTVDAGARLCKKVYDKPRASLPGLGAATDTTQPPEVFLTVPEMQSHFDGCVYIRDNHRVLVPDGALLKPEQFNAVYGGHMFQMMPDGTKPSKKAFEALTECLAHRFPQAKRACFRPDVAPGEVIGDEVNIYVKPTVTIAPGDIFRFHDFMTRLLPDPLDREILISWCAAVVQNPGYNVQWAPVLQGVEGNGKSLIASCMAYILGDAYTHEPRSSQIASQFISFDEHKLLIIVEEIHMGGRREILDELKTRITNRRIEVEPKGQDKRNILNTASWFFCTNYKDAVIKSKNDRRYAVFFTAQQDEQDLVRDGMNGSYFPELYAWLKGGGYAAVAHFLLNYQIRPELDPTGLCQRAPKTSSTDEAIRASTGGVEGEIAEAAESGVVGFRGDWVSTFALERLLRDKGFRISQAKRGEILRNMGYTQICRAPRPVLREESRRPVLWKRGAHGTLQDYLTAQGPGYE